MGYLLVVLALKLCPLGALASLLRVPCCSLVCLLFFSLRLPLLAELEELLDFGHLKVVESHSPHKPVEVLLKLQVLSRHNKAIEGPWLHSGKPSAHLYLLTYPISIPEVKDLLHQFNLTMHLYLCQMSLNLDRLPIPE